MSKLIYQVYLGNRSRLYDHCTKSVKEYADRIGADYVLQKTPILKIAPNPFLNQREGKTGGWKKHGYMPIFEKENVFNYFYKYDQCCVIDADIYVRPTAPDIFAESDGSTVSSVYECDLPINDAYSRMIEMFKLKWEFKPRTGYSFFNSGVMLYNSTKMKSELEGMGPKQFLSQPMLEDFINGIGPLKWQSDQITLNYWFAKNKVNVQRLDWKWNALYSAISNSDMLKAHFVHFFLKDKLPNKGENIQELMKHVS